MQFRVEMKTTVRRGEAPWDLALLAIAAAAAPYYPRWTRYLLYVIQPLASSLLLMAFGMMLFQADLMIPLFIEDKDKTEILFASLPTWRDDLVRGRYLMAGFLLAGSVLLIFGSAAAIKKMFSAPSYQKSLSPLLTVEGVAGFLIAAGLLTASYLPLYDRLGLGRGNCFFSWEGSFSSALRPVSPPFRPNNNFAISSRKPWCGRVP